ncbi:MAG: Mg-protoporphyrin IX methyl transferase [Candidatus Synechococcus spongiarum 142]|uniref:Magnesium protoporphyrin IX methyltransferase n=1 Tax=Candidatus Synechococcus spongiarum 142 TaxID=1608213 RepID=A0A6N3X2V6_9SYNE|nr:MAG: Mg-protoporphyrin IX methyl transferase [Candidatus Synechococcus spongiarum 142]
MVPSSPSTTTGNEKEVVRAYFNGTGFERWRRIYSDNQDVNKVQEHIRHGHNKTVTAVLNWLQEDGDVRTRSFCDAGCGVGSLTLPLAAMGARRITASDLSEAMLAEAQQRAVAGGISAEQVRFHVADLEALRGEFHTVICLDVFIHYPQQAAEAMVRHLASLSRGRLIVSFAPYSLPLALLKTIGSIFPGASKATRAYTLKESGIVAAAATAGFRPTGRHMFCTAPFYFSRLLEFQRCE